MTPLEIQNRELFKVNQELQSKVKQLEKEIKQKQQVINAATAITDELESKVNS